MTETPMETPPTLLADPNRLALRLHVGQDDPHLREALQRASDRFAGAIGYPVHLVQDDTVYLSGNGSPSLHLPARPVQGTPTVKVDGVPVDGVQVGRAAGIIRLTSGCFPDGLDNVEVTYTHGWAVPPADIADAVLEQAELIHRILVGVSAVQAGSEQISFFATMQTGVTQLWVDTVKRYALRGDRA